MFFLFRLWLRKKRNILRSNGFILQTNFRLFKLSNFDGFFLFLYKGIVILGIEA